MNADRHARLLDPALVGLVGLALLASACGGAAGSQVAQLGSGPAETRSSSSDSATTSSQPTNAILAFSRCVRAHGVANYPDPDSSGRLPAGVKEIAHSDPQFPVAENACMHLLSSGAGTLQQRRQKLAFALQIAQCMRRHGFPTFPDPGTSGQGLPPGVDPSSPQFEAAQTTCKKQAQQAVGLP